MNGANRVANRAILALFGLVLVAAGLSAAAVALDRKAAMAWTSRVHAASRRLAGTGGAASVAGAPGSAFWLAVLVTCAAVVVAAVVWIMWQRRGRTSTAVRRSAAPPADRRRTGDVVIDVAVAEQSLSEALSAYSEILGVRVAAFRMRGSTALKISVVARRGAPAGHIATVTERAVLAWDNALGVEIPACIEVVSGIRARTGTPARVR